MQNLHWRMASELCILFTYTHIKLFAIESIFHFFTIKAPEGLGHRWITITLIEQITISLWTLDIAYSCSTRGLFWRCNIPNGYQRIRQLWTVSTWVVLFRFTFIRIRVKMAILTVKCELWRLSVTFTTVVNITVNGDGTRPLTMHTKPSSGKGFLISLVVIGVACGCGVVVFWIWAVHYCSL